MAMAGYEVAKAAVSHSMDIPLHIIYLLIFGLRPEPAWLAPRWWTSECPCKYLDLSVTVTSARQRKLADVRICNSLNFTRKVTRTTSRLVVVVNGWDGSANGFNVVQDEQLEYSTALFVRSIRRVYLYKPSISMQLTTSKLPSE
ncbi:hypothetical protein VI817_005147 [Penicillium citrinum]|nr:hypothetical protein VI817_005147 [Penicillium citrinum]